jgi:hypothetical protein
MAETMIITIFCKFRPVEVWLRKIYFLLSLFPPKIGVSDFPLILRGGLRERK